MIEAILRSLLHFSWRDLIDIILVSILIYEFLILLRGTKAYQMAVGISALALIFFVSRIFNFVSLHWILKSLAPYFFITIIVLYQAEIRKFLANIGSRSIFNPFKPKTSKKDIEEVVSAVEYLSTYRIGGLIAIEKEISLKSYSEKGVEINADIERELITAILSSKSALHDGAIIIRQGKIESAGCLLPLPPLHPYSSEVRTKTRHLAGIGLSAETDSAVVIVSEETGSISLAIGGVLEKDLRRDALMDKLLKYFDIQ
ncbi:MAG: diadenylate cyclase CdaA [Candidatus Aminicenantia bacterium]